MGSGLALKEVLDADYAPKHRKNMEVQKPQGSNPSNEGKNDDA